VNIVILNWQRPLWEGDQEILKRSGRDEPIWFAIHMCMEATLGISLYSYLYLKLAKCYVFLIISCVFSSTKLENKRVEQVLPRIGRGVEMAQTMYTHVSKYKNDKIKNKRKRVPQPYPPSFPLFICPPLLLLPFHNMTYCTFLSVNGSVVLTSVLYL
jgi:hypothetical protein